MPLDVSRLFTFGDTDSGASRPSSLPVAAKAPGLAFDADFILDHDRDYGILP
jgi:hypothetical protein